MLETHILTKSRNCLLLPLVSGRFNFCSRIAGLEAGILLLRNVFSFYYLSKCQILKAVCPFQHCKFLNFQEFKFLCGFLASQINFNSRITVKINVHSFHQLHNACDFSYLNKYFNLLEVAL